MPRDRTSPRQNSRSKRALYSSLKDDSFEPRIVAELSSKALQTNYDAIRALVPGLSMIPMIKANAYGHGAQWGCRQLQSLPALFALGVATLEEGKEVREALGLRGRRTRVFVFSGTAPWTEEKGRFCEENGLTASIGSEPDWQAFLKGGWPARIPYQLKFNTGMNRLGLAVASARSVAAALAKMRAEQHPLVVYSHLASSEDPDSQLSRSQAERFQSVRSAFSSFGNAIHFSLANSSAIWNQRHWKINELTDIVRPGISLYGVPPWQGAPARGIVPVLTLRASVAQVNRLRAGDRVGYGGTFRVSGSGGGREAMHAAILSAGYGDGLLRRLSNGGFAWLGGKATRVIGIVSMDLSAVECEASTRPGQWVEFLGPHVDPWAQARVAHTIPYELFTSLTDRVKRIYG